MDSSSTFIITFVPSDTSSSVSYHFLMDPHIVIFRSDCIAPQISTLRIDTLLLVVFLPPPLVSPSFCVLISPERNSNTKVHYMNTICDI